MTVRPNPILPGFNPDPSIVRVDDAYYLVTSTFEYLPALPVYRSSDLAEWTRIGHVMTRPEQAGIEHVPSPGGVWAPTIRYRDGVFHLIVSIMFAARGCVVFTAADPAGPWSDGVAVPAVDGIDPDLAWDDDGVALVTFAKMGTGIMQVAVDLETGEALEAPRPMWSGTGLHAPEGPHVYRRDDDWYLLIAEGGTERGHAVSIARGPSPRGPFEGCPANPIISARSTGGAVQNLGHADLVEKSDGRTAMVLLGVRPVGFTHSFSPLGRETFLTDVTWSDGWPIVDAVEVSEPAPVDEVADFSGSTTIDAGWIGVRRLPSSIGAYTDGRLRITASGDDLSAPRPAFLGRRQPRIQMTATAVVDVSAGAGGLAARECDDAWFAIEARSVDSSIDVTVLAVSASLEQRWSLTVPSGPVELFITTRQPSSVPGRLEVGGDRIVLGVRAGGEQVEVARLDGRHWSFETSEAFTGRVIGPYASEGTVDVLHFRLSS